MAERPRHQRGAALLLALLVLIMAGLIALTPSLRRANSSANERIEAVSDSLAAAKAALIGYAINYPALYPGQSPGYLPCPDLDNDGSADPPCGLQGETVIGRLPWKQLGLSDLHDESGECLWYAVSGNFKNNPPPPQLNWDSRGQIAIQDATTGQLLASPADASGGVAAAIIAAGPPLAGQERGQGNQRCHGLPANDYANYLDGAYVSPAPGTLTLKMGSRTHATINDRLIWITPRELFGRIKKRTDFPSIIYGLQSAIGTTLEQSGLANGPANAQDQGSKSVGGLPAGFTVTNTLYGDLQKRWDDQFRYARCQGGTPCLVINGKNCRGALVFTGERQGGGPRSDSEKGMPGSYPMAAYLEGDVLTVFSSASTTIGTASTNYQPSAPANDLVQCLGSTTLSFNEDLTTLATTAPPLPNQQSLVQIDPSTKTVTLGLPAVNLGGAQPGDLAACTWFSQPKLFGHGLRAYFEFNVATPGEGFTLAIVDAERNPGAGSCGAAGQHLGYSGINTLSAPANRIAWPKIGLEFDMVSNAGYDESRPLLGLGRNDNLIGSPHMAFVFWGNSSASSLPGGTRLPDWDDNAHGLGGPFSSTGPSDPMNPVMRLAARRLSIIDDVNRTVRIRLDISRNHDSATRRATYTLDAWAFNPNNTACFVENIQMQDFSTPFAPIHPGCRTTNHISHTVTLDDTGSDKAFRLAKLGFTVGQTLLGAKITLSKFSAEFLP